MEGERRRHWLVWLAAALVVIGLYAGAYLWLLRTGLIMTPAGTPVRRFPDYGHPILKPLFAPANRIDRMIRPRFWEP